MHSITPFTKQIHIIFSDVQPDFIFLQGIDQNNLNIGAEKLASILFHNYEQNYYGSTVHCLDNRTIQIPISAFLAILNKPFKHPFIEFIGLNIEDQQYLQHFEEASSHWHSTNLWDNAKIEENQLLFGTKVDSILHHAVLDKLHGADLTFSTLEQLIPYFKNGGWPIATDHIVDGVQIALRLSEPEDSETDWLFETVLISSSGKPWTPPIRKRTLPIEDAIPEKWQAIVPQLKDTQQQLLSLLSLEIDNSSDMRFIHTKLEDADVREFLKLELPKLQAFGFEILLPTWLKQLKQSKVRVRMSASNTQTKSIAGLDDILTFKWQFSMNGQSISEEQFKKLVDEKREFIRVGNEWFRIDFEWLVAMKKMIEQTDDENWTVRDLLFREVPQTYLQTIEDDEEEDLKRDDPLFAFEIQRSLSAFIEQLQNKKGLPSVKVPKGLNAQLRPYQQDGFEWLVFMREQKFGACLADDMGLGKTVQTISYLLHLFESNPLQKPALIICPTSVLGNWQKEIARFAPTLKIYTHYGSNRPREAAFFEQLVKDQPQVIFSTYGTVSQDSEFLQLTEFSCIVLDEAQNIKNMQTLQSRAIRKLNGQHHIALTGTPIENRLSELWAIFDFIHKGYLGSFKTFQEQFILPIERDDQESQKEALRDKIKPFLLRRTKRDPDLLLNLPEKQESQVYCPLTVEQAALYEGYIADTLAALEQLTGFEKKGRILKMLNKLKQLCNHPSLYLKEPFEDAKTMLAQSNKVKSIVNLTAEIVNNGEQCLIFTQYIGMGNLLQHCLSEIYSIDAPFLTGSMPKAQRDRLVDAFQAGEFQVFILSLKAGGTGLNLTSASHVLHADRWWNPAVENQATDRAYRIGQTQFVQVHKFITQGTIEEKIDQILTVKSALSDELIQSSKWITELQDDELLDLVKLDINS